MRFVDVLFSASCRLTLSLFLSQHGSEIVGTPGRVSSLMTDKALQLRGLKMIIYDEADRLWELAEVALISNSLPDMAQQAFVSATFSEDMVALAKRKMKTNPWIQKINRDELSLEGIRPHFVRVHREMDKWHVLFEWYFVLNTYKAIIFCNSIAKVKWLSQKLAQANRPVTGGRVQRTDVVAKSLQLFI